MQLARDVCRQLYGPDQELKLWETYGADANEYIHHACSTDRHADGLECPYCHARTAVVEMLQTRSADEGMSAFLACKTCHKRKQIG